LNHPYGARTRKGPTVRWTVGVRARPSRAQDGRLAAGKDAKPRMLHQSQTVGNTAFQRFFVFILRISSYAFSVFLVTTKQRQCNDFSAGSALLSLEHASTRLHIYIVKYAIPGFICQAFREALSQRLILQNAYWKTAGRVFCIPLLLCGSTF